MHILHLHELCGLKVYVSRTRDRYNLPDHQIGTRLNANSIAASEVCVLSLSIHL